MRWLLGRDRTVLNITHQIGLKMYAYYKATFMKNAAQRKLSGFLNLSGSMSHSWKRQQHIKYISRGSLIILSRVVLNACCFLLPYGSAEAIVRSLQHQLFTSYHLVSFCASLPAPFQEDASRPIKSVVIFRISLRRPTIIQKPHEIGFEKMKAAKALSTVNRMSLLQMSWLKTYSDYHDHTVRL